jgi:hypothetical protein
MKEVVMTSQTKCEEIAAECIERFNMQPIDLDLMPKEDEWQKFESYLDKMMTEELALDIILNFPEEFVNPRLNLEIDSFIVVHPRVRLLELAKCCVRHVVYERVHGLT